MFVDLLLGKTFTQARIFITEALKYILNTTAIYTSENKPQLK
jgi:hypothetical protein